MSRSRNLSSQTSKSIEYYTSLRLFSSKSIPTTSYDDMVLVRSHGLNHRLFENKLGEQRSFLTFDEAIQMLPLLETELKLRNTAKGDVKDPNFLKILREHIEFGGRNTGLLSLSIDPYTTSIRALATNGLLVFFSVPRKYIVNANDLGITEKQGLSECFVIGYPLKPKHVVLPREFHKLENRTAQCVKTGEKINLEKIYGAETPKIKQLKDKVQIVTDADDNYNKEHIFDKQSLRPTLRPPFRP